MTVYTFLYYAYITTAILIGCIFLYAVYVFVFEFKCSIEPEEEDSEEQEDFELAKLLDVVENAGGAIVEIYSLEYQGFTLIEKKDHNYGILHQGKEPPYNRINEEIHYITTTEPLYKDWYLTVVFE